MTADVLSARSLNRATLERQFLLRRSDMAAVDAVEHLVGLQAQVPLHPYFALWSRLDGFQPEDVAKPLLDRELVRIVVMRGTIHLVTADDCLLLRPLTQPVMDDELARHSEHKHALVGVDLQPILDFARPLLDAATPRSTKQLRTLLAEGYPDMNAAALVYACRCLMALVQVTPRGVWGRSLQVTYATAETWLGRPLANDPSLDEVVLRYLAAFGPATVADVAAWCRLTRMREVVDRIRPQLRPFRDERGKELVDLPDAPRPDPDTPAPVRFLPEFDNVLLSHADRSRFQSRDDIARLYGTNRGPAPAPGPVLVDGTVQCTWLIERDKRSGRATLVIRHLGPLAKAVTRALGEEGERLLGFAAADAADHDLQLIDLG